MKRKLLVSLLLFLTIITTGGCVNKKESKYMLVNEITPQYLFDHSNEKIKDFAKKHWDKLENAINVFTLNNYNFRSIPTMIYTTPGPNGYGDVTHIIARSIEHPGLYFPAPVSVGKDNESVDILTLEGNSKKTFDAYMYGYLITYYYQDEFNALNDATDEFIKSKNLKDVSQEYLECMGYLNGEFRISQFSSTDEKNEQMMNYFKNTKYEDYNKDEIGKLVVDSYIPAEENKPKGKDGKGPEFVFRIIFVDEEQLEGAILREYLEYIKNKSINIPPFIYNISTIYEYAYKYEPYTSNISELEFDYKFNILSEFTSNISIDYARERSKDVER